MAAVVLSPDVLRQVDGLPPSIRGRVDAVCARLSAWPDVSGAKPLRGALAGQFRIRTGDYRIQFAVIGHGESAKIVILKVGHRDGFYDEKR